jgi:hypothetical protein
LVAVAVGYCWTINSYLAAVAKEDHFTAFKGVIQRLGLFALLLLLVAAFFTMLARSREKTS